MDRLLRDRLTSTLVLLAASAVLPAAIVHSAHRGAGEPLSYGLHFVLIIATSLIAAGAAFALTRAGARARDRRTVLVGTAFSAMSAMLVVHGVATDEVLLGENGVYTIAGGLALPLGGGILALAALPGRDNADVRNLLRLQWLLLAGIALFGVIGVLAPGLFPHEITERGPGTWTVLAVGLACFGLLAVRASHTFALTRRGADLAVVTGVTWLAFGFACQVLGHAWGWTWWAGHALEFAGMALVGIPVALDLHRAGASRPLVGDLRGSELVADAEAYLGAQVHALLVRLGQKDASTAGHTRRVALRAVQVAEQLGLAPGRLRDLAVGGLLHDMGKLSVPDMILRKPGALEPEEFAVIRRHPEWGEQLLADLGGFSAQVRRLVLDHHERLDGSGYPRGLAAHDLDTETRVLAVCDVYDALVSDRVYREAWSPERALALLQAEAGVQLDAGVVAALHEVLAGEGLVEAPRAPVARSASAAPARAAGAGGPASAPA